MRKSLENGLTYFNRYIDLHLHFDGTITADMARKLAKIQGVPLPDDDRELGKLMSVPNDCRSLFDFLKCFTFIDSLVQTKETISEAIYLVAESIMEQGVIYAEIQIGLQNHIRGGLSQEEVLLAALDGLKRTKLKANLIPCCMRGSGNEAENEETLRLTRKYLVEDGGVVGMNLAGDEAGHPNSEYVDLLTRAHDMGIPLSIHAGEASGADSIRKAAECGAKRIGHGVRIREDREVMKLVKEKGIYLEMCPTSNKITCAVDDMSDYPFMDYLDYGLKVTLNSDDMCVEGIILADEYRYMEKNFGLTPEQEKTILNYSIDAAFTTDEVKRQLRDILFGN